MPGKPWTILNYAFRPFFLLGALFAVVAMLLWLAALHGAAPVVASPDPVLWHAHEMLFGFAGAIIAGFLLTAVATWTGRPQVCGPTLGVLVATWLAGRIAMSVPVRWPDALVAVADLSFLVVLATLAAREIVGGGSRRNFGIAAAIGVLAIFNVVYHLGRSGAWEGADRVAVLLTAHGILLLVTLIGGRIIPSFTANWLRMQGRADLPRARPWVETALLPVMAATGVSDSFGAPPLVVAGLSLATSLLHGLRLSLWRGSATRAEPLLAVLHVAYAWLPIGYLLLGLTTLGLPLPRTAALHALTMGGIGSMVLAVTTRVALGHSGRPLRAAPLTVAAYVVLNAAVLVRILGPVAPGPYLGLIDLAASGWIAAFGLFAWVYWPVLTRARIDGKPERR
jgi:uncharacterized protein involved in response to NO